MMSWQGIEEFVAVVETGSFTQAALRLQLSIAHVSRQIRSLEQRLNVALLYRTTRKVSLTQSGELFYQHCKGLIEGVHQAELAVRAFEQEPQGQLRITAPTYYGEQRLAPLVNDFLLRYPHVSVEYLFTNQQLDLIAEGIDLAIRLGSLQPHASLFAKQLATRQLKVCASSTYLTCHGEPQTLSALAEHNCLLGTLGFWRFRVQGKMHSLNVSGTLRCSSGVALLDAAKKGLGIVQLPDYYTDAGLASGELVELLKDYQIDNEGVWAIYPQQHQVSVNVRLLLQHLSEQLGVTAGVS
ncbi:LysR substrate-binding domain-containing protein [Celerinatantimonas yamalensis]|uniref:LysR substrate-binding domain-containing protein n=1 Tax=Celerinatantimonas yamalensis TaxID=559956 RepID=A0ABW9G9I6_9GAMM